MESLNHQIVSLIFNFSTINDFCIFQKQLRGNIQKDRLPILLRLLSKERTKEL